jgi:demethylmenaquinone methyltransferase/2-methoxy-6-polyprenyl-1,4-benzoquinol methylase
MDVDLVKRKYRRNAALYDLVRGPTGRLRKIAIGRLGLRAGDAVLDFGCGTGLSFQPLEEAVGPTGRIVGVDVSPDMLAKAREKVAAGGWSNVTLIESNAEEVAVEPESVDALLCFYTHDVMRSERALGVAVGALRAGGRSVAAGVKLASGIRGLLLNPITVTYSIPAITDLSGMDRPWVILERLLGGLEVEEFLCGTAYIARGVKPPSGAGSS